MPNLPPYQYTGPVDCAIPLDPSKLKGKSVIVTGGMLSSICIKYVPDQCIGANGMGETTVREFAAAGYVHPNHTLSNKAKLTKESAFVTIADLNVERGEQVARELAPYATPLSLPAGISLTRIETHNSSNATS